MRLPFTVSKPMTFAEKHVKCNLNAKNACHLLIIAKLDMLYNFFYQNLPTKWESSYCSFRIALFGTNLKPLIGITESSINLTCVSFFKKILNSCVVDLYLIEFSATDKFEMMYTFPLMSSSSKNVTC